MSKQNSEDLTDTRPTIRKKQIDVAAQAKWNIALGHLKSKDFDLARKALTDLTDHPSSYKDKASKMLLKIDTLENQ